MPADVTKMAMRAVAQAAHAVSPNSISILSLDPLSLNPENFFAQTLSSMGIRDDDGVRQFRDFLPLFVPSAAREDVGAIAPSPASVFADIEELVEDALAAMPALPQSILTLTATNTQKHLDAAKEKAPAEPAPAVKGRPVGRQKVK